VSEGESGRKEKVRANSSGQGTTPVEGWPDSLRKPALPDFVDRISALQPKRSHLLSGAWR